MIYSVLITRHTDYPFIFDPDDPPEGRITRSEWEAIVDGDEGLKPSSKKYESEDWFYSSIPTSNEPATKFSVSIVECTNPKVRLAFNESTGSIILNDPTPDGIHKALSIASSLNAIVRGYDGEIYSTGTDFHWHSDEPISHAKRSHWLSSILEEAGVLSFILTMVAGGVWRGPIGLAAGAVLGLVLMSLLFLTAIALNEKVNQQAAVKCAPVE